MPSILRAADLAAIFKPTKNLIIIGAAAFAVCAAAPTAALAGDRSISINGWDFDDEDLLERLIEMDADDIADLREEMAEAREEIADAILEIEDARKEARSAPGGEAIIKIALDAAEAVVSETTRAAFAEVRRELDRAARELSDIRGEISAEEFAETREAIAVIREELSSIEAALADLSAAMKA